MTRGHPKLPIDNTYTMDTAAYGFYFAHTSQAHFPWLRILEKPVDWETGQAGNSMDRRPPDGA